YSGGTTISAGALSLGNATAAGSGTISNNSVLNLNAQTVGNNIVPGSSSVISNSTGSASVTSQIGSGSTALNSFSFDGAGNITFTNIMANAAFTVTKNGSGTTTLGGSADNADLALTVNTGT